LRARVALLLLSVALAAAILPAAAAASPPHRTSLTDVEDEVMCPICGTLLALSDSPQAEREKVFISRLVAAGKTKSQIKDALVAEYGETVLALPPHSGFDLSAYLVPVVAFVVAAVALAVGAMRWRRAARSSDPQRAGPGLKPEDAERLDADIARYDL
jgi:cytochrome c-type biogenesis protein CcmH/NrfF